MSMKCQKCGKDFPIHVKIDGKKRNLSTRKYCLNCSPFGSRNTRQLEKPKVTLKERRKQRVEAVQRRRKKLKQMAVEYKGGKCILCDYKRCFAALTFHHLDPKKKRFGISYKGMTRSWDDLKKELDKCVLVCANCHAEINAGMIEKSRLM